MKNVYDNKELSYFSNTRLDIIKFIGNQKDLTILEIGPGNGATLLELKKQGIAKSINGYDLMDVCLNKVEFDSFEIGNIENDNLPYSHNLFDVIILADVLEHLTEPEKTIEKLKPFLKSGGNFYVSLPNIRNVKALYKIFILGNFEYEDAGIFDKTHLRFFCKKDMVSLFSKQKSLSLIKIKSSLKYLKTTRSIINLLTFNLFEQFITVQYLLKISKE